MHSLKMKYEHTDHWDIIQESNVPCVDTHGADLYLNNAQVREAIHVKQNASYEWSICSDTLQYKKLPIYFNMSTVFRDIFEMDSNIWSIVYNGDTDMSCDFLGDEWFVNDLMSTEGKNYREWCIDNSDDGYQVGGWTEDFERLTFVTVRGSGHMVPQYKPVAAYTMFASFLANSSLPVC